MRVIKTVFMISFIFVNMAIVAFIVVALYNGDNIMGKFSGILDKLIVSEESQVIDSDDNKEKKEDVSGNAAIVMESSMSEYDESVFSESSDYSGPPRDNTSQILKTNALNPDVAVVDKSGVFQMDYSNYKDGYVVVKYSGNNKKTKLLVTNEYSNTYIYTLSCNNEITIPLTSGVGNYKFEFYENIEGDSYTTLYNDTFYFEEIDEFLPYLYPNYYVNFAENNNVVAMAKNLAEGCYSDIDVIKSVYNYISENIEYDYAKADTVKSNYIPDADATLEEKKGICFDYAVLISAMLRSQGIPTRLEIGYCDTTYHAWVSVYTKELGWVNKILWFNGQDWTLLDPVVSSNDVDYYVSDVTYYSKYNY